MIKYNMFYFILSLIVLIVLYIFILTLIFGHKKKTYILSMCKILYDINVII